MSNAQLPFQTNAVLGSFWQTIVEGNVMKLKLSFIYIWVWAAQELIVGITPLM